MIAVSSLVTVDVGAVIEGMNGFRMSMVVLPVAESAPPVPWLPVLPSSNVQSICTLSGGMEAALV